MRAQDSASIVCHDCNSRSSNGCVGTIHLDQVVGQQGRQEVEEAGHAVARACSTDFSRRSTAAVPPYCTAVSSALTATAVA